jgi:hypothetical protein
MVRAEQLASVAQLVKTLHRNCKAASLKNFQREFIIIIIII